KPAAQLQILTKILHAEDVMVKKRPKLVQVAFDLQPPADMLFVGKILIGHVAGVAAVGNLAHSIDAEERNDRACRILANLIGWYQPLTGDDQLLGGTSSVEIGDRGPANTAIAKSVGLMHMNCRHMGIKGR